MTRYSAPALLALALTAACASRPLTEAERRFAGSVMGPELAAADVRIVRGAAVGLLATEIPPRPRTTCQERLHPERDGPVPGVFPAMAFGQAVYFSRDYWQADFLAAYPEAMELREAMWLAHELTHVWQWQRRDLTGYHPLKASFEHVEKDDPYLIEIDPDKPFLAYGYEQQGAIVEEFVCCRALDPDGGRTDDLRRLLAEVFPGAASDEAVPRGGIALPWDGAETRGICD